MIQKLSQYCMNYLLLESIIKSNEEDNEIYRYGIEVIISDLLDILLIFFVAVIQSKIIDGVIYYLVFGHLRKFTGGYHCRHYYSCITMHVLLFLIYTLLNISNNVSFILGVLSALAIILIGPVENMNRKIDEKDMLIYDNKMRKIICSYVIIFMMFPKYLKVISYVLQVVLLLMLFCIKEK